MATAAAGRPLAVVIEATLAADLRCSYLDNLLVFTTDVKTSRVRPSQWRLGTQNQHPSPSEYCLAPTRSALAAGSWPGDVYSQLVVTTHLIAVTCLRHS